LSFILTLSPLKTHSDHIFESHKTNEDIYDLVAKPIVSAALEGFNGNDRKIFIHTGLQPTSPPLIELICFLFCAGTIFAYGQTSSGKTYTMTGDDMVQGIIPLAVHDVFAQIAKVRSKFAQNRFCTSGCLCC
jgi:centromeric protein E